MRNWSQHREVLTHAGRITTGPEPGLFLGSWAGGGGVQGCALSQSSFLSTSPLLAGTLVTVTHTLSSGFIGWGIQG